MVKNVNVVYLFIVIHHDLLLVGTKSIGSTVVGVVNFTLAVVEVLTLQGTWLNGLHFGNGIVSISMAIFQRTLVLERNISGLSHI